MYSFPVTISDGAWAIVDGLPISEFSRENMEATARELQKEKDLAERILAGR